MFLQKAPPKIAPEDSDERPLDENGKPVVQPGEAPREEDGYVPPKKGPKWDKEKHGWLDKKGNVYPGGLSRGGYKPFPHLPLLH